MNSNLYRIPTPNELENLKSIWHEFTESSSETNDQVYSALLEKYNEPHRAYHNVGHLVELFEYFEKYRDQIQDQQSIALALFFHDVVYNISDTDNEEQSAKYATKALSELNVNTETISRTADLIEMTKTHLSAESDLDASLMLDMDIAALGAPTEQYKKYSQAIEAEYTTNLPTQKYYKGRLRFLESIKQRDNLFITKTFKDIFEKQLLKNINYEQNLLKEKLRINKPKAPDR